MRFRVTGFQGMFPRVSPRLIGERQAQRCKNFKLTSGELVPYRDPEFVQNVTLAGMDVGTIFRWKQGGESYWFRHPGDVDVVQGPVIGDVWERVYFTGDSRFDEPRYTMTPQAYTGGTNYPVVSYKLGVPAPEGVIIAHAVQPAPITIASISATRPMVVETVAPHGLQFGRIVRFNIESSGVPDESLATHLNSGEYQVTVLDDNRFEIAYSDGENVEYDSFVSGTVQAYYDPGLMQRRFYVHTYVTEFGEEGPPSEASGAVDAGSVQPVTLTLPTVEPSATNGRLLSKRRIYRSAAGTAGAAYRFVAELDIVDEEFTDEIDGAELAESLQSANWDGPPEGLRGIMSHPSGTFVGFEGADVYFSEPYRPHAWPEEYRIPVGHEVVAIGVFDTHIVVATTGLPYLITGMDPRSMSVRRLEVNQSCSSKRSMVSLGYACVYASAYGLVHVSPQGAQLITRNHITVDEWAGYHPETIRAFEYEGRYIGFYDAGPGQKGGFVFDPREPELGLVDLDFSAVSGFREPESEALYLLLESDDIVKWDAGADLFPGAWRSKVIHSPDPINIGSARVIANGYDDLTFRLFADGALAAEHVVTSREPFPLPSGYSAMDWQFEVDGTEVVAEITIAETPEEAT